LNLASLTYLKAFIDPGVITLLVK